MQADKKRRSKQRRRTDLTEDEKAGLWLATLLPPENPAVTYYTITDAAALMGRSYEVVRRWVKQGQLKAVRTTTWPFEWLIKGGDLADIAKKVRRPPLRPRPTFQPVPVEAQDIAQEPQEAVA